MNQTLNSRFTATTVLFFLYLFSAAAAFAQKPEVICITRVERLGNWNQQDKVEVSLTNLSDGATAAEVKNKANETCYVMGLSAGAQYEITAKGSFGEGEPAVDVREVDLYGRKNGEVVRVSLALAGASLEGSRNEVAFVSNSTQFESQEQLGHLLEFMLHYPLATLRIEAYAAENEKSPEQLSQQRGQQIYKWLTDRGIDKQRLLVRSFGSRIQPLANNETDVIIPSNHAQVRVMYSAQPTGKLHNRVNYVLTLTDQPQPGQAKVTIYRVTPKARVAVSAHDYVFFQGQHIFDLASDFRYEVNVEVNNQVQKFNLDLTGAAEGATIREEKSTADMQN